ncbi:MAG: 2-oxo acid dehydrogenase subunit E2 [Alphaproteobacteria bacterium]|nr:2-oxo acid dehydrogenase subunit E2 [Alphaproteobacteria bacterium]
MFVFELPEIGEGVVEGEIVRWLVQPGELVAVDQPVCEIMTDKATVEISTPKGGRVAALHGEPGDVIKVHTPLADIETGELGAAPKAAPQPAAEAKPAPVAAPAPKAEPAPPVVAPIHTPVPTPTPTPVARDAGEKALATPAVRRHARELELDINQVPGSGKGGRVTHADLEAYTSPAPTPAWSLPAPVAPVALPQSQGPAPGEEQAIKIIGLRRKIAEQMVKARFTAPHFTYVDEVDMTDLVEARKRLKGIAAARGVKLTFLPFIMKALVQVFRRFPNANANVIEDPFTLVLKGNVNIGIATDTDRGLYVPVVKDVQAKTVLQLAAEIQDLTERTRQGKVSVDELQGGSFTITSVGNIGGMFATPIINHPEVAILGINRIHKRPVVMDDDSIAVRHMLYLSSSFDHRVLDGAVAARFTTALKELLETPEALLLEMI